MKRALVLKLIISGALLAYMIHPFIPTAASLVWLWIRLEQ